MKSILACSLLALVSLVLVSLQIPSVLAIRDGEDSSEDKIVFVSDRDGNLELYIMDSDGTNPIRLTDNHASEVLPFWSPDGTKIGFTSDMDDGNNNLYVMDMDGSNLYQMTPYNEGRTYSGNWSPDGKSLVYYSNFDGQWNIYVEEWGSNERVQLTSGSANYTPVWSPDGTEIAFMSERDGSPKIYLMNADGSNQRPLVGSAYREFTPQWSPDGSQIVFVVWGDDNKPDIVIVDREGRNFRNISLLGGYSDKSPSWSPDGTKIVFQRDWGNDNEIFIMDADGSNVIQLTDNEADDIYPRWQFGS